MEEAKAKEEKSSLFPRRKNIKKLYEQATQEMYKRNLELAETNQTLSLLRTIDKLVLESHDGVDVLCQTMAVQILDNSNLSAVAIMATRPRKDKLELLGHASLFEVLNKIKQQIIVDSHRGWVVSPDRIKVVDLQAVSDEDIAKIIGMTPAKVADLREKAPLKSAVLVKLLARHRIVGVMMVGLSDEASEITEKQMTSIDRLCEAVGVAIDNNLLFEENQYVLRKLQRTNEKLKEMDETKDEFISMASHQLRTPLTSVKGYLSMVLEGDAGKLNEMQNQLLSQAFVSSQRMVYLIADLLNVSRLKTGKFVIDVNPTNLAEVVESEITQLTEQAKSKNITVKYAKPKDFPELLLDETKIRQVIMNFADNALYYTPSGGKVDIELKDDKGNIYFMVKDNGLGVPKEDQRHLFGKFFRASNARKARPDGTGLGLFMAKRVVSAQGGNIVFESKEGEGSTFGFCFSKKHLAVPEKLVNQLDAPEPDHS